MALTSESDHAPIREYRPPTIQAHIMSATLGRRAAISLGVRMIPDPKQLPRDTAMPKPTPKTRKKRPLGCHVVAEGTAIMQRAYHEAVLFRLSIRGYQYQFECIGYTSADSVYFGQ
jgi:hypothetical protein